MPLVLMIFHLTFPKHKQNTPPHINVSIRCDAFSLPESLAHAVIVLEDLA